jgi:CubicO group peptidase (beta-lactamase class C family)
MRLMKLSHLAALFVIVAAAPALAQTAAELPPDMVKKIEEAVKQEMTRQNIPGLSIAVATDNRIRYANGFGMADLENSVPAKATTAYRTASIAKPITAAGVMQLAERGKLDLDAPIQKYCPAFPEKPWPVTARQLLAHLGGVRHYAKPGEASGTEHYFTVTDSLKLFKDDPLLHEPGTKFHYTTYGYSVLGCAIEGASGMSYEDYMRENVFKPAGMERTRLDNHYEIIPDRARGYMKFDIRTFTQFPESVRAKVNPGQIFNAGLHDTSMKVPGGGLVSTAVDLVKFAIAMQTGALVKKGTLEQMWVAQKTRDGKETGYGLGWGVGSAQGMKLVSHSGGQAGVRTYLSYLPEKGIAIAVMTNVEGADPAEVVKQVGRILLPQQNGEARN